VQNILKVPDGFTSQTSRLEAEICKICTPVSAFATLASNAAICATRTVVQKLLTIRIERWNGGIEHSTELRRHVALEIIRINSESCCENRVKTTFEYPIRLCHGCPTLHFTYLVSAILICQSVWSQKTGWSASSEFLSNKNVNNGALGNWNKESDNLRRRETYSIDTIYQGVMGVPPRNGFSRGPNNLKKRQTGGVRVRVTAAMKFATTHRTETYHEDHAKVLFPSVANQ
jgi:hypothetical protein